MKRVFSEEHRKKLSEANFRSWQNSEIREKRLRSSRFKGHHHTEETKEKLSLKLKGQISWIKGRTKETDERIRKGGIKSGNSRKDIIPWNKGKKYSEEVCKQMSKVAIKSWQNKERRKRGCLAAKKLWQNKEYREQQITRLNSEENVKKALKGLFKRPTSFEKKIIDLCKKYNFPYKYVGDGELIICYRNPDFVNVNGQKKLIEPYYSGCHPVNYEESRGGLFAKYGWKTLFLNEKDLCCKDWEQVCLKKITDF